MVVLFEGSVLFAVLHDRRKARRKAEAAAQARANALDDDTPSVIDPIPRRLPENWSEAT